MLTNISGCNHQKRLNLFKGPTGTHTKRQQGVYILYLNMKIFLLLKHLITYTQHYFLNDDFFIIAIFPDVIPLEIIWRL